MIVRVYDLSSECTRYTHATAVRVADNGCLFIQLSNSRDVECWAAGQWVGYSTEGA